MEGGNSQKRAYIEKYLDAVCTSKRRSLLLNGRDTFNIKSVSVLCHI